jgi:non-specific serine/threonine protein kinase
VAKFDAVALLIQRFRAADAGFIATPEMGPALAAICRRLDGLPLAIELVAPRIRVLPVAAIAAALDNRLPHLVRGPRDAPARHQTMRAALAWSYQLLDPCPALVFRHAGAFVGGWTLAAANAVVPSLSDVELLDAFDDLVTQSLVQRDDIGEEPRFRALEVVREFAAEQLAASGEAGDAGQRHAEFYLDLAQTTALTMGGDHLGAALSRLELERGNLRQAILWALDHHDAEMALRLCASLRMLWYVRGSLREGRALFAAALALRPALPPTRVRGLTEAAALARHQGDFPAAATLAGEAVALARITEDARLCTDALLQQGFIAHLAGDYTTARSSLVESERLARTTGDRLAIARAVHHLGFVAMHGDADVPRAATLQQEALSVFRALGHRRHVATALIATTQPAVARRDHGAAWAAIREALAIIDDLEDLPLLVYALHNAAAVAADQRDHERALRLLGAVDSVERVTGAAPWPAMTRVTERWLRAALMALGERGVATLRGQGAALSPADAVAYAVNGDGVGRSGGLTRREHEIAALVAEGLTNREIAARLFISERTVDGHVARVLGKLDFRNRAQIAGWIAAKTGT